MKLRLAIMTALLMGLLVPRAHANCPEQKIHDGSTKPDPDEGDGTQGCASDPDPEPDMVGLSFDIRAGVEQTQATVLVIACVEARVTGPLSVQLCGNGRGLFLDKTDDDPVLTGYRARLRLTQVPWGRLWVAPILHAGMSELRVGQSGPGYLPGRGSSRQLALGPAAGVALQLVWPLGDTLKLVGDVHLDAAWIPRADELALPQDELQPSLGATVGVGF